MDLVTLVVVSCPATILPGCGTTCGLGVSGFRWQIYEASDCVFGESWDPAEVRVRILKGTPWYPAW